MNEFEERFLIAASDAVDLNDSRMLGDAAFDISVSWAKKPTSENSAFSDDFVAELMKLMSHQRFLDWEGSFNVLFLFETDWGCLTLRQRLELCQFLGTVYEKLKDPTSQLVIVELLGKYLATAYSLQALDRLSAASNEVARAYVAYGYKCLVLNAAEQEVKKKAEARLTAMATDSSEVVRLEVAAAVADIS